MVTLPVVPLSQGQLLDVRSEDIVADGLYRTCNTYRGGGGYDQFPGIAEQRGLGAGHSKQFVVQLYGCTLDCPYCYVTREGVWSEPTHVPISAIVDAFKTTDATVFHLMGGAPALYLFKWAAVLDALETQCAKTSWLFHSDLLLNERNPYNLDTLRSLIHPRALYAVDIKALSAEEAAMNTRKPWREQLMWDNLAALEVAQVPYYITFTSVASECIQHFWQHFAALLINLGLPQNIIQKRMVESFNIDLIDYKARIHVDNIKWGKHATR